MIRVLHLIDAFNVGGLEKQLLAILGEIPREKVAMDFVCKGKDTGIMAPTAESLGARIYHCPLTPSHVGFARGLARVLKAGTYDIVHNQLGASSGLGAWVARRCGVRVITSYVSTNPVFTRWSNRRVLGQINKAYTFLSVRYAITHSDLVTGVSSGVLDAVVPDHRSRANCLVLHGGVSLNVAPTEQECAALRRELGLPTVCPLVLHVGRFSWEKNHGGVVQIFKKTLQSVPEARLLLAGAGPLVEQTKQAVIEQGLESRVHFLGLRDDMSRLMRCSQVFLLPSFFEGLPVTVLEALASSLPVVASAIPGIADEVIRHEETGFLHSVDQLDAMARSVVQLLNNPALAARIVQAGRALVESHFSLAATIDRHVNLYERCMQINANPKSRCPEVSESVSPV